MTRAWRGAIPVDERARAAWPHLPLRAPPASVWIGACGETVRVRDDGTGEAVLPPGHPRPGPASDPCNARPSS